MKERLWNSRWLLTLRFLWEASVDSISMPAHRVNLTEQEERGSTVRLCDSDRYRLKVKGTEWSWILEPKDIEWFTGQIEPSNEMPYLNSWATVQTLIHVRGDTPSRAPPQKKASCLQFHHLLFKHVYNLVQNHLIFAARFFTHGNTMGFCISRSSLNPDVTIDECLLLFQGCCLKSMPSELPTFEKTKKNKHLKARQARIAREAPFGCSCRGHHDTHFVWSTCHILS